MEQMSITLMNRALNDRHLTKDDPCYYSVQAEHDIWPVAAFRILQESHECLKCVLD
jgi:hypothetical protein